MNSQAEGLKQSEMPIQLRLPAGRVETLADNARMVCIVSEGSQMRGDKIESKCHSRFSSERKEDVGGRSINVETIVSLPSDTVRFVGSFI